MKISIQRFLMTAIVGTGLFAVLIAHRSNPSKDANTFEADLSSYTNAPAIFVNDLATDDLKPAMLPEVVMPEPLSMAAETESLFAEVEVIRAIAEVDNDLDLDDVESVAQTPLKDPRWKANPYANTPAGPVAQVATMPERALDPVENYSDSAIGIDAGMTTASVAEFVQPVPKPVSRTLRLDEVAAQKAVHHIEYGKSLARRNATEAAGQEFLAALRVLAESNDSASGSNAYAAALRSGLIAMKEAEDFKVDDPHRQIIMNVNSLVEAHETQVIGEDEARTMTASDATKRYLEYAGRELGACGGQNVVAAEALYCLGKMRSISSQANPDPESMDLTQAIIFHHASLMADPSNYRSANELGVLLARNGQLDRAEEFLKASLKIRQVPQSWANLAKVHQRKGTQQDAQLANLAMNEYQTALHQQTVAVGPRAIQWVEPGEFNTRSPMESPETMTAQTQQSMVLPASNTEPDNGPSIVQRIGSMFVPKNNRR